MLKVFQTPTAAQAQYKVHITQQKTSADLLVYLVSNPAAATGKGIWYVTKNYQEANRKIHFCNKGISQLSIYFVNSRAQAGWQNPAKHLPDL